MAKLDIFFESSLLLLCPYQKPISQFCHFYPQILYHFPHCPDAIQILSTLGFPSSLSLVRWLPHCHPQPPASGTAAKGIFFFFNYQIGYSIA